MRKSIFLFLLLFSIFFSACNEKKTEKYFHSQGSIFRTDYNVKYEYERNLSEEITARLDSFDLSLNPFNKNSIIYKVNQNEDVEVDYWFSTVFNKAQEISEITNGVYDITSAPLINLWGFGFEKMDEVTPYAIDSLKQFVGYEKVRLVNNQIEKDDPRLQLNASSIAKGYACDVIGELLEAYGIDNYMVEIGGEVRAKGLNPRRSHWRIEISKPIDDATGQIKERLEIIELNNYSLATSGNYRNFYLKDGKKIAHTINPITGYPSEETILSATVLYPNCMTADAFATAFMALGVEKASQIAEQIPDMECLFVYAGENGDLELKTIQKNGADAEKPYE